jgi:hypothetical protein
MFYQGTSGGGYFIKACDDIVREGRFRGIPCGTRIISVNPGVYSPPKLIWYMAHLQEGDNLTWLSPTRSEYLRKNLDNGMRLLHLVDIGNLKSSIRNLIQASPEDEQNIEDWYSNVIQLYGEDELPIYAHQLMNPLWHERRLNIFTQKGYKCENCEKFGTVQFIIAIGPNRSQSLTFSLERFVRNQHWQNSRKILDAIDYFKSLNLPAINLDWSLIGSEEEGGPIVLHLHHQYYILGRLAWEYDDDCFKVLCKDCHSTLHQTESVPVYESEEDFSEGMCSAEIHVESCNRCAGEGYIEMYKHVMDGICFKCWGDGFTYNNADKSS